MASSSSVGGWVYDVFLSFRGTDVRKTFVGHLYNALDQRGIRTFKDDEELERGKSISPELIKNINESNIAVIVFSKNYASSSWCLDELVEILECSKTKRQTVLPIFYDVKASQVRNQKRSFMKAFGEHEEIHKEGVERVHRWRAALKEAANISGFDLQDAANGDEAEFVQQIVREISKRLEPKSLKVADNEVGIDLRANKVMMLLNDTSKDKLFVAICGIGGIGKTTVAKAVFNRIYNEFDGYCFLENVRAESTKHGLAKLQEKLLRETLMDKNVEISNFDRGINEIKVRLQKKKILVVLDDVDDENQLTSLAGIGYDCFGSGSRIIITTRNERVFINYNVKIYKAELLDDAEALELFSWHAFKQNNPVEQYLTLSNCLKHYAKGLPLALKVLGSHLYKRDVQQWESVWDGLKSNPPDGIQGVLEISYNGLDKKEKSIFLDIACFFNGCDKKFAMDIFENCGFDPVNRIQVLIERYLITISKDNELRMHDLIQEMGREIVRRESNYQPEMQSRLWSYEDIYEVFAENKVTENIEAIMLSEKRLSLRGVDLFEGGLHVNADDFRTLKRLRILKISGVHLDGCLTYLSNELRYLDWEGYPAEYLPSNFNPKKLVGLNLSYSPIKGIGTNIKFLKMLKVLNLTCCKNLEGKNLNFSVFSFLEELYLMGCENLVEAEFDDMIKLKIVDLSYCKNLKKVPNLSGLSHLKELNLSKCSKLEKFPEIQRDMKCLEYLWLGGTAIKELPPSVVQHLKGLRSLKMCGCKLLETLPSNIGEIESLEYLDLGGTVIKSLPSLVQLTKLKYLYLDGCLSLQTLESLPSSTFYVSACRCVSLEGYSIPTNKGRYINRKWTFTECHKLVENHKPNIFYSQSELPEIYDTVLPGNEIPSWFSHIFESESSELVRFWMDSNSFRDLRGLSVCAVFGINQDYQPSDDDDKPYWYSDQIEFEINICSAGSSSICNWIYRWDPEDRSPLEINRGFELRAPIWDRNKSFRLRSDHIFLFYAPRYANLKCNSDGCYIGASLKTGPYSNGRPWKVKKWGFHPVVGNW